MKILLIEDDEVVALELKQALIAREYAIDLAADGRAGWQLIEAFSYDLILLDIILPELDGIGLCRQLRSQGIKTPVILIAAADNANKKVIGLDAGADDFIIKPFDLQELLARIRALLRRGATALPPVLTWGKLNLNPGTMEVRNRGKLLHLTPKEYSILELFLRNPYRVFSRSLILDRIWSFEECPSEDTVTAHIKGLRMKLKNAGADDPIETVYGVGYRLKGRENFKNRHELKQQPQDLDLRSVAVATSLWQHLQAKFNEELTAIERASAKVTIVDEDRITLTEVTNLLQPWGIEVTTLTDAREFRATFQAASPDLPIFDVKMSGTNGLELCQIVRKDFHRVDLPVLLLTDLTDAHIRERIFAVGADEYVSKPIVGAELLTRILNCLEKTRSRENNVDIKQLYF